MNRKSNQFSYTAIKSEEKKKHNLKLSKEKIAEIEAAKTEYSVPGVPGLWVMVPDSVKDVPLFLKNYAVKYKAMHN